MSLTSLVWYGYGHRNFGADQEDLEKILIGIRSPIYNTNIYCTYADNAAKVSFMEVRDDRLKVR